MQEVIEQNLELMSRASLERDGSFRGGVVYEAFGGVAGFYQGHHCTFVNFAYEPETGRILGFRNPPELDREMERGAKISVLKVAVEDAFVELKSMRFRVVEDWFNKKSEDKAIRVILETIRQYNERYGF